MPVPVERSVPAQRLRLLQRAVLRRRRPLAAGLVAVAVLVSLQSLRPPEPAGVGVVVANTDLAAGTELRPEDVSVQVLPSDAVPAGAARDVGAVVGRSLSGAVREREPLTDVRLQADGLATAAGDAQVALPLRLADGGVAPLLDVGGYVDVLAADGRGSAQVVAQGAEILAVPPSEAGLTSFDGALVVLALSPTDAADVAAAAAVGPLSVALRG